MSPDRLGPFVLQAELGRGGMGTVYRAVHGATGETVAIKVLAPEMGRDPAFRRRFEHEIAALAVLDHPNIVKFYGQGEAEGLMYYAMEYVPGQSLDRVVEAARRLPWSQVVEIGIQTSRALKHAHDHGIIHRDLKMANLLMTAEEQIKLTDFGIAKVFSGTVLTAAGSIIGTAEYMSPEQAEGRPITRRSDLYSLGIVLYGLVTGRLPFSGKTVLEVLNKQRYGRFDPPRAIVPELPVWLDELIVELLEKDPARRPPDAFVVARRLELVRRKVELQNSLDSPGSDFNRPAVGETAVGSSDRSGRAEPESFALLPGTIAETGAGGAEPADEGTQRMPPRGVAAEHRSPGPATLVDRLLQVQVPKVDAPRLIGRFLQRTGVLLGLLIAVLGLVWWCARPLGPQQLYRRGMALARSESPADQDQAKEQYFEVLVRKYPRSPYAAKARARIVEIEQARPGLVARVRSRLAQALKPTDPAPSPAQRFYLEADQLYGAGKIREALAKFTAIAVVFRDIPAEAAWVAEARKMSAAITKQLHSATSDSTDIETALRRAQTLAESGKRDEARWIWQGIVTLYRDDPDGQRWVEQAQKRLNDRPSLVIRH